MHARSFRWFLLFAVALAGFGGAHAASTAYAKKQKTHVGVPADRILLLQAYSVPSNDSGPLKLDGLQLYSLPPGCTFIATDLIVDTMAASDTTSAIWVSFKLGNRTIEVREKGASTRTISLTTGVAVPGNITPTVSNFSSVEVTAQVLGYVVQGNPLDIGETPH